MNGSNGCAGCGAPLEGADISTCEDCGRSYCAACAGAGGLCPHCFGRLHRPS